jgi:cytochrome c biogenesis protein
VNAPNAPTVVIEDDTPTPGAPTPGAPPPGAPERHASVADLFRRVYQLFYSKTLGLVIILAMTVLALLGVLIGQASATTYASDDSRAAFLEQARHTYGGFTPVLDALGLFRVFTSPLFLVVVTLLALSITACTVHRIPRLWRTWRHPRRHVSDRFFDRARLRGSAQTGLPADDALAAVTTHLRARRYRVLADPSDPRRLYVDRGGWGPLSPVVTHLSFLVILLAFVLSAGGGIDETLVVPVGREPVEVGHGTGLTIQAGTFDARYDETGRPVDYVSDLVLRDGDTVVAQQESRVNTPLRHGSIRFHQSSFGIAADVVIADATGTVIFDRSVPLQYTAQSGATVSGRFSLPEHDAEVWVTAAASGSGLDSGLAAGEAVFELHRLDELQAGSTEPAAQAMATQGEPVNLAGLTATFEREREYTGILVRQDPGRPWMWVGSALLIIGMTLTFGFRHRRMWLQVTDDEHAVVRFASNDRRDLAFERRFTSVLARAVSTRPSSTTSPSGDKS